MKSIKIFATVGAIALLGMAGLTSCNQKNGPVGPDVYNGETVKTEFTISIPEIRNTNPAAAPGIYRMPAANTQETGFLGMEDIKLMPFVTTVSSGASVAVQGNDTRLGDIIGLSDIAANGLNALSTETSKYKVYSDVQIPLRTNHFLFYAKGKTTATPTETNKFEEGLLNHTDWTNVAKPSDLSFSLQQICVSTGSEGANLCSFLTEIATAHTGDGTGEHDAWSEHEDNNVKGLYDAFITMHAGSANSVLAALEDLYNSLDVYQETYKAQHSNNADAVVAAVTDKIVEKVSFTGSTIGLKTAAWNTTPAVSFATYPTNLNLPDGAAAIVWDNNQFNVASTSAWAGTHENDGSLDVAKMTDYVYPSCLYYYVNSGLKTAPNTPLAANASAISSKTWAEVLTAYYTYEGNIEVNTNTRSVAISDPIQYSVARLKTSVKANAATIEDAQHNPMDVTKLQMTAVLVGGQGGVGFDFIPTETGNKIVYDKALAYTTDVAAEYSLNSNATSYTNENPTLVLETKANDDILMAVEFVNTGADFYGKNGLIPHGTKFYVVAQLKASEATNNDLVTAQKAGRVFAQDFTTTVKLNLKTLANAYNVIPDLRSAKLELGFSVDLSWKAGYTYEIDIN